MRKIFLLLLCCVVYWPSYAGDGASMTGYVFRYVNSCHYRDGDSPGTSEPMWFVDDNLKNTTIGYAFNAGNTVCYLMNDDGTYNPYISYDFNKSDDGYRNYDLSALMMMGMYDEIPMFLAVNADFSVLMLTGDHGKNDRFDRTDFYSCIESGIASRPMEEDTEDNYIYNVVEKMPEFHGGDLSTFYEWVQANLQYPANGAEGRIIVEFVVEKDGTLSNFNIVRSPDQALSDEALRVLKLSPKWTPGTKGYNSDPVRVRLTLPVSFSHRN